MPGMWSKVRWVTVFNGTVDTDESVELDTLDIAEGVDVLLGISWSISGAGFTGVIEVNDPLNAATWNVLEDTAGAALLAVNSGIATDGCRLSGTDRTGEAPVIPPGTRWHHTASGSGDNQTSLLIGRPFGG